MEYILIGGVVAGAATAGIKKLREVNQTKRHRQYINEMHDGRESHGESLDYVPVISGSTGQPINMNTSIPTPSPTYLLPPPPLPTVSSVYPSSVQFLPPIEPPMITNVVGERPMDYGTNNSSRSSINGLPQSSNYYVMEPEESYSSSSLPMIQGPEQRPLLLANEPYSYDTTSPVSMVPYQPATAFNIDPIVASQEAALRVGKKQQQQYQQPLPPVYTTSRYG